MVADNLKGVKIGFIGAGNMAKAIGGGLVKNGVVDKSQIFVTAPSTRNLEWWENIGVSWVGPHDIVKDCGIIFLAMKPQTFENAISNLVGQRPAVNSLSAPVKLWVSILAGTTIETLENGLKKVDDAPCIIRVMPNTPMTVGQGCSVYCGNSKITSQDRNRMDTILGSLGKTFEVKEELIDSISSLMGSSPAFMYIIIEAMSDIGVKMGVPRDLAIQLSAQAMAGAAHMVLETGRHPGVLKDEVCSPGGSTIVGLHMLEQRGVRGAVMDTLEVVAARNKELGKLSSSR